MNENEEFHNVRYVIDHDHARVIYGKQLSSLGLMFCVRVA